jgi:hypothetical protein
VAWETIKQKLLDILDKEDKSNPLSDENLVSKLQEAGYPVARRTVIKYRKMLSMPSSRQRKQSTREGTQPPSTTVTTGGPEPLLPACPGVAGGSAKARGQGGKDAATQLGALRSLAVKLEVLIEDFKSAGGRAAELRPLEDLLRTLKALVSEAWLNETLIAAAWSATEVVLGAFVGAPIGRREAFWK